MCLSDDVWLGLASLYFCDTQQHLPAIFVPSLNPSPFPVTALPPTLPPLSQRLLCVGHTPRSPNVPGAASQVQADYRQIPSHFITVFLLPALGQFTRPFCL